MEGGSSVPGTGPGGAGGSPGGFHNISNLPLGNLLEFKQQGRAKKKKGLVSKLITKGFR